MKRWQKGHKASYMMVTVKGLLSLLNCSHCGRTPHLSANSQLSHQKSEGTLQAGEGANVVVGAGLDCLVW
uniref:Uncharacterized protein n=1 Tax=Ditylenchus dipsaci TaxID=166011 RepID=A0A915DKS0_9BILA